MTDDPTGYRRIYDRLVKTIKPASRPTKQEFARVILRDRRLFRPFVVTSAETWWDAQNSEYGAGKRSGR